MVKWREVFSRAVYLTLTTVLPGGVIGWTVDTGDAPYWASIAVSLVAWVTSLAYGMQRKRVAGYRLAITRMQAKLGQDATITYLIRPEGAEDET